MKADNQVKLTPEDDEDIWNIYNLISLGDVVTGPTYRKIADERSNGDKRSSKSVKTNASIGVESIDYDISAQAIRLNGKNVEENEYIKIGSYHSLSIEPNRAIKIQKAKWDRVDNELLNLVSSESSKAELGAVIFDEGIAHVCLISSSTTRVQSKIVQIIPKKHKNFSGKYNESIKKFYSSIYNDMVKYFDFEKLKCVILASPGFYRDQLLEHIIEDAKRDNLKNVLNFKSKFLLVHSTSGFIRSLNEVLCDEKIRSKIEDLNVTTESFLLNELNQTFMKNEHQAIYGIKHCEYCSKKKSISDLLMLDKLYRSKNLEERKQYVKLNDQVKQSGGNVLIFSSMSETGKELARMGGVAGILKYPMPEIDDIDF